MGEKLEDLRKQIDDIDANIIECLNARAKVSCKIGKAKEGSGQDFYSPSREEALMKHWASLNKGPLPNDALKAIFREILSVSRALQKELVIAYLGPEATFTQQAAVKNFGSSVKYSPLKTIPDVFDAIERSEADYGVIPIENSNEGSVIHSMDMLLDSDLKIVAEIFLPIEHCLISNSPLESITMIYSKDQALGQCRDWLRRNAPKAQLVAAESTVEAIGKAASGKGVAVIASALVAERYEVSIVQKSIQDKANNTTRFLVIGREATSRANDDIEDKTSILLTINDEPGALQKALEPFGERKINLMRIESRPSRRKAWNYVFFIDFNGHWTDPDIQETVAELKNNCPLVKWLGSYPNTQGNDAS